jgi:uncharacterized membrane protein
MKSWTAREWILAASVGVNLVLISFLAGVGAHQLATPGPTPPRAAVVGPFQPRMLIEGLPADEQERARVVFRREGARSLPLLRAIETARADLEAAMLAEDYDPEAVAAALDEVTAAETRLSQRSNAVVVQILGELSPEQRARLVERLSERRFGGPGRGPGGPDGPRFDRDRSDGERRPFRQPPADPEQPE